MSEPFTNASSTPSGEPVPLPRMRDLFALYMTGFTVALVGLILTADLVVLLLRAPEVGVVGLLCVVAPLYALQIAAFTSLVNGYVVWRMSRDGHVEYGSYGTYDSYGVQALLTSRSRRLLAVSIVLLLVLLPLAAVPHVSSSTPLIGALGSWQGQGQGQDQAGSPAVFVLPTDVPAASTATDTALPTDTTTTNTAPTATARPTGTAVGTATPTSGPASSFTVTGYPNSYKGCATNSVVPPATVVLDNSKGTTLVFWHANARELIPGVNTPWATITDAATGNPVTSGMIAAGETQRIIVTPAASICHLSRNVMSWHVDITTVNAGGPYAFTYTVSWS
jgi:hypothetical protein